MHDFPYFRLYLSPVGHIWPHINKEFHLRISFSLDIINYNTTRKRLDAITTKNITSRIKEILIYIK